jgi:hypothetical protein
MPTANQPNSPIEMMFSSDMDRSIQNNEADRSKADADLVSER